MKFFFWKIRTFFDIEKWLWKSDLGTFWQPVWTSVKVESKKYFYFTVFFTKMKPLLAHVNKTPPLRSHYPHGISTFVCILICKISILKFFKIYHTFSGWVRDNHNKRTVANLTLNRTKPNWRWNIESCHWIWCKWGWDNRFWRIFRDDAKSFKR